MKEQHGVTFPMLRDEANLVARQYGLAFELPYELRDIFRRAGANLEAYNGEKSWTLPIPATYVIVPDETIVYGSPDPDYTQRPEPEEIVQVLEKLRAAGAT